MSSIQREVVVPFTAQQMYDLVNDIPSYPHFLPYCQSSQVLKETKDEVHASLTLAKGGFAKSFTTCNRLEWGKRIEVTLINGPFRYLEGFWHFENKATGGSEIRLALTFELAGGLINMAFEPLFIHAANKLVDAFYNRAKEVYGHS